MRGDAFLCPPKSLLQGVTAACHLGIQAGGKLHRLIVAHRFRMSQSGARPAGISKRLRRRKRALGAFAGIEHGQIERRGVLERFQQPRGGHRVALRILILQQQTLAPGMAAEMENVRVKSLFHCAWRKSITQGVERGRHEPDERNRCAAGLHGFCQAVPLGLQIERRQVFLWVARVNDGRGKQHQHPQHFSQVAALAALDVLRCIEYQIAADLHHEVFIANDNVPAV